MFAVFIHFTLN